MTNDGGGRIVVEVRCAVRTDSVCVCVSDSFLTAEKTEVAESFDLGNVF